MKSEETSLWGVLILIKHAAPSHWPLNDGGSPSLHLQGSIQRHSPGTDLKHLVYDVAASLHVYVFYIYNIEIYFGHLLILYLI